MGLHWGLEPLQYLVPAEVLAQVKDAQVDPHVATRDTNWGLYYRDQVYNILSLSPRQVPGNAAARPRRHWGKSLVDIEYFPAGERVAAKLSDGSDVVGSIIVATDGPYSTVRYLLVSEEAAKATPIDFASKSVYPSTREHALFLRSQPHHPFTRLGPIHDTFLRDVKVDEIDTCK